jgi:hypothetical protein
MSSYIFITYDHPSESAEPSNRQRVARHVATHYRNRSAPTRTSGVGAQTRRVRRLAPTHTQPRQTVLLPQDEQLLLPLSLYSIPRDQSSFRHDPFAALPTRPDNDVMAAIDYCKDLCPKFALRLSV